MQKIIFLNLFLLFGCSSVLSSPYHCGNLSNSSVDNYDGIKVLLIDADVKNNTGIFKISNNGKEPIELEGWKEENNFRMHTSTIVNSQLNLKSNSGKWEEPELVISHSSAPDIVIDIKPNESKKIVSSLYGANTIGVNIFDYAFRLSFKISNGKKITSEPYCFTKENLN